ncbi:uncharacterized protein LOC123038047 [Drosophila rhopaloa]|uniref:DUF5641 domain-containing protein n=1 Tax=Drosophila rhopaloa TaxID=1041015 RepID=A0ABM5JF41_DRORH|nr:uncharacterized protein LOC123038047 [Drosophila rhopaloa]
MELGKWVSNSSRINDRATSTTEVQDKGSNRTAKVLCIHWDPEEDTLSYKVCLTPNPDNTKRQVLSDVARIFDPLRILSPVVVQFKILFQELWLLDLGWDTELPPKITDWWNKCHNPGKEEVKSTALTTQQGGSFSPIEVLTQRVSSWTKLVHAVAYASRFLQRTMAIKTVALTNGTRLTYEEIQAARILCLQEVQKCFMEDRNLLAENKQLRSRSQLIKLPPFVGKDGLLRVGGRLGNSQLPASHRITRMILEHEHIANLHPAVSALFHSGCDYAGPFIPKERRERNPRKTKGYILFVCLVTSAIHLELATNLSTDTFLACLRRFMSLRGKCSQIFSDNGTNFVGTKRVLDKIQQHLSSQDHQHTVTQSLANDGIKWSFIPPHSPHWGGKWESSVRSVKLHLRRVVGKAVLTFEQMQTLIVQISAVHLQSMYQGFWKRWHQEYLTSLQQRQKWNNKEHNIAVGSVVLVKDSNLPPAVWILARVLEAHHGPDGLVRAVKLKTSTGEMTRPITKLPLLPNSETMFQGGPGC